MPGISLPPDWEHPPGDDYPEFADIGADKIVHPANWSQWFIAQLPHIKGDWAQKNPETGKRYTLGDTWCMHPERTLWQRRFIRHVFGKVDKNGKRRIQTGYAEVPKKNGKTTVAAGVGNYMTFGDGEPGAEVYSAAYKKDQAKIAWNLAASMVERTDWLAQKAKVSHHRSIIEFPDTDSFYVAIARDALGEEGMNPHCVIFDELHTQKDPEMWNTLKSAPMARSQPLILAITFAGHDTQSICYRVHDYTRKVNEGIIDDPAHFGIIFGADPEEDDWQDEDTWEKVNPNYGLSVLPDKLRARARMAAEMPSEENDFKRRHLNIWTSSESKVIGAEAWKACRGDVSEKALAGASCFGGLDLASKEDVAACLWIFPDDDRRVKILPRLWVPEETVDRRTRKDGVPYRTWVEQGHLIATPGNKIDYTWIEHQIREDAKTFDVEELAFDAWGSNYLTERLDNDGVCTLVPVRQGFKSMSEPTKELLAMVRGGEIIHDGNPVMRWMADNFMVTENPTGAIKPTKKAAKEKIDGLVALINALSRWIRHREGAMSADYYEEKELLVL